MYQMSTFFDLDSSYNPWDLNELSYVGKLYHYTDKTGCDGIITPKSSLGFPTDCISLRFTRIEDMTRNDPKERRHIMASVQKALNNLRNEQKGSERHISAEFADTVQNFPAKGTDVDVGLYTLISDKQNKELGNYQVKMGYNKLDYYVACFSTDPDNEHIMRAWSAPIRLAFKSGFSNPDEMPCGFLNNQISIQMPGYYHNFSPYPELRKCFIEHPFKRVSYDEIEKCKLIENLLLYIYKGSREKKDINIQLHNMYSLYDAFFKKAVNEESGYEYWKEKEVRLVIRLPHGIRYDSLKKYGLILDAETEHNGEITYKYLYLPVDKTFLMGGDTCA